MLITVLIEKLVIMRVFEIDVKIRNSQNNVQRDRLVIAISKQSPNTLVDCSNLYDMILGQGRLSPFKTLEQVPPSPTPSLLPPIPSLAVA